METIILTVLPAKGSGFQIMLLMACLVVMGGWWLMSRRNLRKEEQEVAVLEAHLEGCTCQNDNTWADVMRKATDAASLLRGWRLKQ